MSGQLRVTAEFAKGVVETAQDAGITYGIGYWAEWQGAYIVERESPSDDRPRRRMRWSREAIQRGVNAICSKDFKLCHETRGAILAAAATGELEYIDGPASDIIIQAAMFGELVYG